MKFPFLASFIVFLLILNHTLKRREKTDVSNERSFWAREREANSVRRKSLDHLNYIQIPLQQFPLNLLPEDSQAMECQQLIEELASQKIVNLTGFSNTDLKLEYGTANINVLSELHTPCANPATVGGHSSGCRIFQGSRDPDGICYQYRH